MTLHRRVVIVEDSEFTRSGFEMVLKTTNRYLLAGSYATCEDALQRIKKDNPDIVLIDLELPGINGLEGIERIKRIRSEIDIVVFSIHEKREFILNAIRAGAIGYISKNSNNYFYEVVHAFDSIASGGAPLSGSISRILVTSMHRNSASSISLRERNVLELLAQGKTYSEIAEKLFISKFTVRTHIRNLYQKLSVRNKSEAIERALADRII